MCLYITRVTHVLYAIIECMLECSLCIRPTRNDHISVNRTFCPPDVREQDTNSQEGPLSARLKQQRTQTGSKMSYRDLNLRPPIIWWTQGSTKKNTSTSLFSVPRIRGLIAGPLPPFPLRCMPLFSSDERVQHFYPGRVASNCACARCVLCAFYAQRFNRKTKKSPAGPFGMYTYVMLLYLP